LVPPLSLVFIIGSLVLALLYCAGFLGLGYSQAYALTAVMLASVMIVLLSWLRYGRATLTPSTLVKIPLYILWKLPIYFGLFKGVEKSWIRTERPEK
ncbi:MAG: glycosyl transferase, partial [Chakrabartia sp.]